MRDNHSRLYAVAIAACSILPLAFLDCQAVDRQPPAVTEAKWHPGHYALISNPALIDADRDPSLEAALERAIASLPPGMQGIQGGAYWYKLEPEKGVYDFSILDLQSKLCAKHGKRAFFTIAEKIFNSGLSPAPAYIADEFNGIAPFTRSVGATARIWDPRVLDRFILLIRELGKRYDGDPNVEGIEFMETAFSCDGGAEASLGYTTNDYIDSYKRLLIAAKTAFPNSVVIQETNFLPSSGTAADGEMADFFAFCASIGVGIGGPDLYPDKERNPMKTRVPAYAFFPEYSGRIPLASDVQQPEYLGTMWYHGEKTWFGDFSPEGILDMGLETLCLNYFFWADLPDGPGMRFSFREDVVPMLERRAFPVHAARPEAAARIIGPP